MSYLTHNSFTELIVLFFLLALYMNMQKKELSFFVHTHFLFWIQNKIAYYIFRVISPKLTINIYEYAHSFFGVDFQSNAL